MLNYKVIGEILSNHLDDREFEKLRSCQNLLNEFHGILTVTRKGNKIMVSDGKYKGVAKCNAADKFAFHIGLELAYERLLEAKEKQQKSDDEITALYRMLPDKDKAHICELITSLASAGGRKTSSQSNKNNSTLGYVKSKD